MLIHQLSTWSIGTYAQMQDEMYLLDMLMSRLKEFYLVNSALGEDKILDIMKRDTWFDANECIKNVMVDKLI